MIEYVKLGKVCIVSDRFGLKCDCRKDADGVQSFAGKVAGWAWRSDLAIPVPLSRYLATILTAEEPTRIRHGNSRNVKNACENI